MDCSRGCEGESHSVRRRLTHVNDGSGVLNPRHGNGHTRLSNDNGVGVGSEDGLDELVALSRKGDGLAVVSLGLPVRVGSDDDNGEIRLLGELSGLVAGLGGLSDGEGTDAEGGGDGEGRSSDDVGVGPLADNKVVGLSSLKSSLGDNLERSPAIPEFESAHSLRRWIEA